MHINGSILKTLSVCSILPLSLFSCGGDRVFIEFKTPREIYVDDSKTDPDMLNKELEYDIREAEKKRRQKEREAEATAKAKAEAERKTKEGEMVEEQTTEEGTTQPTESEGQTPQQ